MLRFVKLQKFYKLVLKVLKFISREIKYTKVNARWIYYKPGQMKIELYIQAYK